ncbi:MAG: uroporphyrinogen decarboxylase [Gammaproteobacteria bacterium]|nr:uroporphyrinogen decarboxylase [Gammaproteobacteria bacterium]
MTIKNTDRFLRALARKPVDCTPVWIMRQAGRYLPEYREIRSKNKEFLTLCKTPELACEVTLQPLKRFALDAAIIFSDILTIPDAMGLGLYFETNEGPRFLKPIRDAQSIAQLPIPDMENELLYVMDAIRLVRKELDGKIPLIGFTGSPWTLATYMVEGGSSKNFHLVKRFLFTEPQAFKQLLDKLVTAISLYLKAQAAAGAQALMIFDTWGGILTPHDYQNFSLNPMSNIIHNVKKDFPEVPIILFTKNGGQWLSSMVKSGADALGLDWTIDIGHAREQVGDKVALQGNMDPSILYASPERIREEVRKILHSYGHGSGHIFNLGHGIHPEIPPENVAVLVDAVHEFSQPLHQVKAQ